MSFFNAIKNIFGFGPDEDLIVETDGDETYESTETEYTPAVEEHIEGLTTVPTLPEIDPVMKQRIFDGVVEVFNSALPDFLARSIDPAAQTRLLAEKLDRGVDDYLNSLMLTAEQYAEAKLKSATESAMRESERLRSEMQQIDQQRTNLREQQLSADRRRRALADRVNDLETQLASSEAEREQFELENRSLLNKLKVADIQPGVVEEMTHEIEQLKARLAEQQPAQVDDSALAEAEARIGQLTKENEDLSKQFELAQSMYNDLQHQYADEREGRLSAENSLSEARKIIESVAEIQEQMKQVEEVIRKRDERIAKLKSANKKLRDQLTAAEEALKTTRVMHDDGLFAITEDNVAPTGMSKDTLTAIEDEFECPEWFVSEPAPGETSPLLQHDSEFGYQEPPKKPRKPENDAQLSLF